MDEKLKYSIIGAGIMMATTVKDVVQINIYVSGILAICGTVLTLAGIYLLIKQLRDEIYGHKRS